MDSGLAGKNTVTIAMRLVGFLSPVAVQGKTRKDLYGNVNLVAAGMYIRR